MKYFWHFLISISVLALFLFIFFVASLRFGNNVHYTDTQNITEPTITFIDPSLGPTDAVVTVVFYGDYACDTCAALDQTLITLAADAFQDDLRIVWKDMPNVSQHSEAYQAALAARCAQDQDKFWEYHTLLITNHNALSADLYPALAENLGLKSRAFSSCMQDEDPAPVIQSTFDEGLALGVSATPTLFINGERYTGAIDSGTLKAVIRQAVTLQ